MHILEIRKNDAGQRLDKFLQKAVKTLPVPLMYRLIRQKKIKVNRKRAEQKQVLLEGDTVELFIKEEFFETVTADNIDAVVEREIGRVFAEVLTHAGVYKCTEEGRTAFQKFVYTVNK